VWFGRPNTLKKQLKKFYWYGEASTKILKKQRNKLKFIIKRWYGFLPPSFFTGMIILAILSKINGIFLGIFLAGLFSYLLAIFLTTLQVLFSFKKMKAISALWIIPLQHISYSIGIIRRII
jgi:hypothetical protein